MDRQQASPLTGALASLGRGWRIVATVLGFASFGLACLLLRLLFFPLLRLLIADPARRHIFARHSIQMTYSILIRVMYWLGIYTFEFHGQERLQRSGLLILANHPSLIDVMLIGAHVRNANCVVNARLAGNFFTGAAVRAAGFIRNDSGPGLVEECIDSLNAGANLIIFPEGTRSRPGEALIFQRGAANIAIRGERSVTPVVIHCEPPMLLKGQKWYKVPARRPHFVLRVQADLPLADLIGDSTGASPTARHVTQALHHYFTTEVARHAGA